MTKPKKKILREGTHLGLDIHPLLCELRRKVRPTGTAKVAAIVFKDSIQIEQEEHQHFNILML